MSRLSGIKRDEFGRIPSIWTKEKVILEATKYSCKKDFRLKSNSAYQYAVKHKFINEINIHTNKRHRVTDWDVFCSVKKSNSIFEFRTLYSKEYYAYTKRKKRYHHSLTSHMPRSKTERYWDHEKTYQEAKKYKYKSDFSRNSSGAYDYAMKNGILKDVTSHMDSLTSDFNVVYIWTAKKKGSYRVIKVGVTSKRLGLTRIFFVARKSGFSPAEVVTVDCSDALSIERKLLSMGEPANLDGFSGSSEFVKVNDNQYEKIIEEVSKWSREANLGSKLERED